MKSPDDQLDQAVRDLTVSRLWDALQESGALGASPVDSEDIVTITRLHETDDVPAPDDETIQRMWSSVAAATMVAPVRTVSSLSMNGNHAVAVGSRAENRVAKSTSSTAFAFAEHVRTIGIAVLAGFVVGALTLGGGGRIAMRVAAALSGPELQGATTENLETVGSISLSGTLSLIMTGGLVGIALGLAYLAIRGALPADGWKRWGTSGLVFFAICGFVALEGGNVADYERFGIAGINICLFTLLPFLFGLLMGPVFDRLDQALPPDLFVLDRSPATLLKAPLLALVLLTAFAGFFLLLVLPPLQLFLVIPLLAGALRLLRVRVPQISSLLNTERLSWLPLAVPSLLGLMLTVLAIGKIM